jgi:hypothetical protein
VNRRVAEDDLHVDRDEEEDPDRQRVDKAYLKAVFDNPLRSRRIGRVFADAGWACAEADNVTAVCEVSRSGRRYAIFAGYHSWGEQRWLQEDLVELAQLPHSRWLKPRQSPELLARAGAVEIEFNGIAIDPCSKTVACSWPTPGRPQLPPDRPEYVGAALHGRSRSAPPWSETRISRSFMDRGADGYT